MIETVLYQEVLDQVLRRPGKKLCMLREKESPYQNSIMRTPRQDFTMQVSILKSNELSISALRGGIRV